MRKLFRILAVTLLSVLLSSCATEPAHFTDVSNANAIGVMLYEGSEISEDLSVDAWRQPEGYVIRLWFRNSGSGGYSDEEREYMEALYPVLTQYGRKEIESDQYSYIVHTSSDITMASVGKGASVRSDKEIAGLEPGADLGDLFLLSAVSPGNAVRYRFPDYQVAGRYYLGAVTETFSSYSPGYPISRRSASGLPGCLSGRPSISRSPSNMPPAFRMPPTAPFPPRRKCSTKR